VAVAQANAMFVCVSFVIVVWFKDWIRLYYYAVVDKQDA
jgi:hypothetical protein